MELACGRCVGGGVGTDSGVGQHASDVYLVDVLLLVTFVLLSYPAVTAQGMVPSLLLVTNISISNVF